MSLEEGVDEILANGRGFSVVVTMPDGETALLRRTKVGVQIRFPNRPNRETTVLTDSRQQSILGSVTN